MKVYLCQWNMQAIEVLASTEEEAVNRAGRQWGFPSRIEAFEGNGKVSEYARKEDADGNVTYYKAFEENLGACV